jgi:hypothetical protein
MSLSKSRCRLTKKMSPTHSITGLETLWLNTHLRNCDTAWKVADIFIYPKISQRKKIKVSSDNSTAMWRTSLSTNFSRVKAPFKFMNQNIKSSSPKLGSRSLFLCSSQVAVRGAGRYGRCCPKQTQSSRKYSAFQWVSLCYKILMEAGSGPAVHAWVRKPVLSLKRYLRLDTCSGVGHLPQGTCSEVLSARHYCKCRELGTLF